MDITVSDLEELWDKQNGKCVYTGQDLKFGVNHPDTVSLDRRDSSLGYSKENIQLVSKIANTMKLDYEESVFIRYCGLIAEHNTRQNTQ